VGSKKLGIFRTIIAFFLGVGVTVGVQNNHSGALPAPLHTQPFAAVAPAGDVTSGGTGGNTSAQPAPLAPVPGGTLTTEQITNQVGPAVVTVINRQKFTGNPRALQAPGVPGNAGGNSTNGSPVDAGLGSGVIYDPLGYLITNSHVVEGANAIDVVLADGTRLDATLVGRDPSIDVAVVKIDPAKVPAVAVLGDSDKIQPGQRVIAIGSPEALENTVTEGIISGVNRTIQPDPVTSYVGLIQTDAAINHGNSGGPLLNAQGEVIGINTLGIRDEQAEGLNFAIPINHVKQTAQTIVAKGGGSVVVTRAYLGVNATTLDKAKAQDLNVKLTDGAYVQSVDPSSPADKAGIKKGDVITAMNGTTLNARTQLGDLLNNAKPGDSVMLTVDRNGSGKTFTVTVTERPAGR